MSGITEAELRRIARLTALDIDPGALAALTRHIADILHYVSQLEAIDDGESGADWTGVDVPQPLRADEVRSEPLHRPLDANAPAFVDGMFVVPKVRPIE